MTRKRKKEMIEWAQKLLKIYEEGDYSYSKTEYTDSQGDWIMFASNFLYRFLEEI